MTQDSKIPPWIQDSRKLAELLAYLTVMYDTARWRHNIDLCDLPTFLTESLGPPLSTLPTYFIKEEEKTEARGLGRFLDIAHREMRNLGKEVGSRFLPELKKVGIDKAPEPKCPFTGIIGKVTGQHTADAEIKVGDKTIPVVVEAERITARAFSTLAASRGILQRGRRSVERKFIEAHTGSIFKAFESVQTLARDIIGSIKNQHPEYSNLDAERLGLDISRKPQIARKAAECIPDARALYNFFWCMGGGIQNDSFEDLVSSYEKRPESKSLYISNVKDIAATFFGIGFAVLDRDHNATPVEPVQIITKRLAECTNLKAAAEILNGSASKAILDSFVASARRTDAGFLEIPVRELEDFRNTMLGIPHVPVRANLESSRIK